MLTVAIIGRPNVGKSTLFNRIAGRRLALVDDTPGVTRDRRQAEVRWGDLAFTLIDTAGLEEAPSDSLQGRMRAQSEAAIAQADICLFVVDARQGITPVDESFSRILRSSAKPVLVLANKAEGRAVEGAVEAYRLGLGDPIAVSAEHGDGMADLYQAMRDFAAAADAEVVDAAMPETEAEEEDEARPAGPLRVAVIGRPNAGKSTLINRLIGEERLLTGPEAGITRDAIAVDTVWNGEPVRLFDTAGLRRKARVTDRLEQLSVGDALRSIRFAEVVIVLIDAQFPLEKQDLQIVDLVAREGRALVVAANKWDLISDKKAELVRLSEMMTRLLPQVRGAALVPVSARTGAGLGRLQGSVLEAARVWNRRVPTPKLNRWLAGAVESHPPPAVQGRRVRLRYMTQAKTRPPTFILFSQRAESLPDSYQRYLINGIREAFGLPGTPIRLHMRKGDNPYVK